MDKNPLALERSVTWAVSREKVIQLYAWVRESVVPRAQRRGRIAMGWWKGNRTLAWANHRARKGAMHWRRVWWVRYADKPNTQPPANAVLPASIEPRKPSTRWSND